MFNWLKSKKATYKEESNVIAAYGAVLDQMYTQHPEEEIYDIRALPYPKPSIKAALREVIAEDPEDEGLRNCYLALSRFQELPESDISDEEAEKLVKRVIDEENALKRELLIRT